MAAERGIMFPQTEVSLNKAAQSPIRLVNLPKSCASPPPLFRLTGEVVDEYVPPRLFV
jgi:hypothetical protein